MPKFDGMYFLKMRLHILQALAALFVMAPHLAGAQGFTEISQQAGINHFAYVPNQVGGGVALFDYNNDGWLDLYLCGGMKRDLLYRNNGNGTFTETGMAAGLVNTDGVFTVGVATGDINNDGFRDIFVATQDPFHPGFLFRNNGNGTFVDMASIAGITHNARSMSATMGDYNLDGFLDIYVANYVSSYGFIRDANNVIIGYSHTGYLDFLYRNNGNGTFTQVASQVNTANNGTALAAAFWDYDNDRDMDIFAVNDFGEWVVPNKLFRNNYPTNSFTDVAPLAGADAEIYGMGSAIGDYDEDGDLDYYMTNIGENILYRNNGNGTFTDAASQAGVAHGYVGLDFSVGWGTAFLDYDNDTRLDLFVSNGALDAIDILPTSEDNPNKLFRNIGNGSFTDVSAVEGVDDSTMCRGFAMGDLDNDGDLDLVVVGIEEDTFFPRGTRTLIFRNDLSNSNNWLKVQTRGTVSNRDGFGARLELHAGGRKWIREIDGGSSFASHHSSIAHFGLGNYSTIDSLIVIWPGGNRQFVGNRIVNRQITVVENGSYQVIATEDTTACGDSVFIAGSWRKASGTYRDTFGLPGVFDSIIVTRLTLRPPKYTSQSFAACSGDSIFAGGSYQYQSGTYYDTLPAANGCDSVVTTIIHIPGVTAVHAAICTSDSFFAAGAYQYLAGTYFDTFQTAIGCDSIIITHLATVDTHIVINERIICLGDSLLAGGSYQTGPGAYYDSFTASGGCDSIIVTLLEVALPQSNSISRHICEGDSFLFGSLYLKVPGLFTDSLTGIAGCDSVVELTLEVNPVYEQSREMTLTAGDSVFAGGEWRHAAGIFTDSLLTGKGCDSIIITELIITSLDENSRFKNSLEVYPNPTHNNFFTLFSIAEKGIVEINLSTMTGSIIKTLIKEERAPGNYLLQVDHAYDLPGGVYLLSLKSNGYSRFLKLIKF